ncbi:hypothetical protein VNO77_13968 [Canavalia gladiata]|uniref:Uncharacterized protein n=1 Tax=Canavalia gladiata TaxID=3824 RepID=A0AAN9LYB1_CANGL
MGPTHRSLRRSGIIVLYVAPFSCIIITAGNWQRATQYSPPLSTPSYNHSHLKRVRAYRCSYLVVVTTNRIGLVATKTNVQIHAVNSEDAKPHQTMEWKHTHSHFVESNGRSQLPKIKILWSLTFHAYLLSMIHNMAPKYKKIVTYLFIIAVTFRRKRKRKKLLFVTLSPPQAPHFVKKWGSQHCKRNHESIALPVVLIGLGILDRPNYDEGETERIGGCVQPKFKHGLQVLKVGSAVCRYAFPEHDDKESHSIPPQRHT